MSEEKTRIIVRRRGKSAGAHPHGAWKIALADFMTTMMALFLVLWVVATATPEQRRGLSDYFNMSLSEAVAGGRKDAGSTSVIPGGGPDPTPNDGHRTNTHLKHQSHDREQGRRMRRLRKRISMAIASNSELRQIRSQLHFEMTPKGMIIEMVDSEKRPMFELGSDKPMPYMRKLLHAMAPLLNELPNKLSIYGYTDSIPYSNGEAGYSNWELSSARANASRRELVSAGLDSGKLMIIAGVADRIALSGTKASDPANRRIEVLVLAPHTARSLREQARRPHRVLTGGPATKPAPKPARTPTPASARAVGMTHTANR
jgi:chemotaxis protein MotB